VAGVLALLPLLGAALRRHRLRLAFTVASILIAFLLYGLLAAVENALTAGVEVAGQDRLITTHKVSIIQGLPRAYLTRVRGVAGVRRAASLSWFGGTYQSPRNVVVAFSITPNYFDLYRDFTIEPAHLAAWQADRMSAIVGDGIATRYGWKVGEVIPLMSNIYRRKDGASAWPLRIAAIYHSSVQDPNTVFLHYEYFNEGITFGNDQIGWIIEQLDDPTAGPAIAHAIDSMFANSRTETKTSSEKAVAQSFANQIGNIGAILRFVVSAVFFAMLLVTANTMAQSVRERTPEIAVLKTLGFSDRAVLALVLAESLLITLVGGLLGLGIAALATRGLGAALRSFLPFFEIPGSAYAMALAWVVALGVAAGAVPAWSAMRLRIVTALRTG
jgi:putative ABC transport system permease protein